MGMTSLTDGLDHLEKITEDDLRLILRQIFYKVETLGYIMKIDVLAIGALKRIMRYVLSVNILLVESSFSAEDETDNTKAILSTIKSANTSKLEEVLFLTKDIAREYYTRCGIA